MLCVFAAFGYAVWGRLIVRLLLYSRRVCRALFPDFAEPYQAFRISVNV
jgi:hypothetical protein